jgi:hypothetical protein
MYSPDAIDDGIARRLGRLLVDQAIPAGLAAGLHVAQRFGYVALVPLNVVIERQYGSYAVFLSAIAAFVASSAFTRVGRRFGIVAFLSVALVSIAMVTPFVLARYGMDLGLTPMQFSVLATYAYLGFAISVGLLVGGCWSLVIRVLRDTETAI